jgi:DNA repair protein RadC
MKIYPKRGTRYRQLTTDEIIAAANTYRVSEALEQRPQIGQPRDAVAICRALVGDREAEQFGVLFLDTRHRLIAAETLFTGTIDGAAVYPRDVAKRALVLNAAAVVLTHNHPSGDPEPSEADRSITLRISKALGLLDIRLLDHVVIGSGDQHTSLAERGWL